MPIVPCRRQLSRRKEAPVSFRRGFLTSFLRGMLLKNSMRVFMETLRMFSRLLLSVLRFRGLSIRPTPREKIAESAQRRENSRAHFEGRARLLGQQHSACHKCVAYSFNRWQTLYTKSPREPSFRPTAGCRKVAGKKRPYVS